MNEKKAKGKSDRRMWELIERNPHITIFVTFALSISFLFAAASPIDSRSRHFTFHKTVDFLIRSAANDYVIGEREKEKKKTHNYTLSQIEV
jgi:hypothetical protein